MSAQVAADLRAAAEVLRRDGWTQGEYFDGRRCCQAGALIRVIEPGVRRTGEMSDAGVRRWQDAEKFVDLIVAPDGFVGRAIEWQDAPGRTVDEVIAALEAAAHAAERKAAYNEGRWCGECQYDVVMDPPCCTQGPAEPQSGNPA